MKNISVDELIPILGSYYRIFGSKNYFFNNVKPSETINENSLDWVNPIKKNKLEYIKQSKAKIILCDASIKIDDELIKDKCLIVVENPKLTFLRIANKYFTNEITIGIHKTAVIHPEAKIAKDCYIGPLTYIGKCEIDSGTIIHGNCYLYDNIVVGKNVLIHAGTVIGADGFGYQRSEDGSFEKFPHIGGVIIKDNVEIGSNTSIDRGALGNTVIGEGAKIDNLVHIAHNVVVGNHSAVIANTMVGGSTIIGDYTWVAPSVSLRDQISIGTKATVGMGAVVTKNIPDEETWTGSPAKPLKEFLTIQEKIKSL